MNSFKKYLYWATLSLFAYMPFHIFISQYFSTFTGGLDGWKIAKDVFTAALVSLIVCATLITRRYTRPFLVLIGFAIVYLLLHIISWLATDQPNDTGLLATVYNNRLVWYLLIGYGLALLMPEANHRRTFVKVLIGASTIVCLIGLAQWVLPKDIMTHFGYSIERGVKPNFFIDDKPDFPRIMSTIRDPNSLGAFLILPTVLLTLLLTQLWNTKCRLLLSGLLLLHLLAALLTFSRSAWIALFIVGVVIIAVTYRRRLLRYLRQFAIPVAVLVVMAGIGLFVAKDNYFVQNVVLHADNSTQMADPNELRVQLAQKGVEGILQDPEGRGPGTAGLVSTRLPNGLLTENYYLQIAYEVGVIGLLLFVAFLVYLICLLWRLRNDLVVQALLVGFIGLSFMNALLHAWANEAVAASWFIVAGIMLGANGLSKRKDKIL